MEHETGDAAITSDLWERMVEVFQWPGGLRDDSA
jgi:hypothetical protein